MKSQKIFKKSFSLLLILSILALSNLNTYAATALKASNVETWPTITYKNPDGKMYYGQTQEEALVINDDEIVKDANGNVVDGHFVFSNPSQIPSAGERKATITFVPTNESEYTGFKKSFSNVKYTVESVTPSYVDEINDPVVATEVEPGSLLSASILSGGAMTNPHNPEEPNLLAAQWIWSPSLNDPTTTIVTESGYYTAQFLAAEYNMVTTQVYVKIASAIPETSIAEYPTISELTYDPNVTWADVTLEGGKAVIKGTETEVEGTFAIKDTRKDVVPNPNFTEIEIVFTPANAEEALPNEFKIPVTVNPSPLTFVDDEGNPVEDFTFEVEPGTKMNDIKSLITTNLRVPKNAVISVEDNNGYAENGRTYKLTVLHDDPYYTGKDLYFTVSFKEKTITPSLKWVGAGKLKVDCGDYSPPGSFAVYYVIGETETKIGDVKGNSEILEWNPTSSGDYGFKVVYNPIENDYFIIESVTTTNYSHFPEHKLIATGSLATLSFSMGETATVTAPATDPALLDKPYYGFTGWTDVKGNTGLSEEELANETVSFAMPDGDVELTANYKFSIKLYFEWVWQQIVQFFTFIINAVKDLFALATV